MIPLYRIVLGVFALITLAVQFTISVERTPGFNPVNFFSFFTNLSNILAACLLVAGAVWRPTPPAVDLLRGAAALYMTVTGLIYNVLLVNEPLGHLQPWANDVLHRIMPLVIIADWLLVPPAGRLKLPRALIWLVFPIVYLVYSLVRGAATDWYPYPFLDPDEVGGYGGVAAYAAGITVVFVLLMLAVTWVGNARRRAVAG